MLELCFQAFEHFAANKSLTDTDWQVSVCLMTTH